MQPIERARRQCARRSEHRSVLVSPCPRPRRGRGWNPAEEPGNQI